MTSSTGSMPEPPTVAAPTGGSPPPSVRPPRQRSAGHVVMIVIGALLLLPGIGMIAGGGAIVVGQAVATDDDGYFHVTLDRIESDGVAVTTSDPWLDGVDGDGSPWVFDWLDLDLRLRVDGAASTDEVFVGIARAADVERYLSDAGYSQVVELDNRTPRYREVDGAASVGSPGDQQFWSASVSGEGEQDLTWTARGGRWSIVVMNADGSPDVAADVEIGVRSDAVTPIAITLLVLGGITAAAAIVLIVLGARGRRTPGTSETPVTPTDDRHDGSAPLPPPTIDGAVQLDDERSPTSS